MVDDFCETLESNTTLTDVSVEQTNANDDVGKLAKLSNFLGGGKRDKRTQTSSRQHTF
jgi:hypothetical protein